MKKLIILLLFISCNNQSDENNEQILNPETVEEYLWLHRKGWKY